MLYLKRLGINFLHLVFGAKSIAGLGLFLVNGIQVKMIFKYNYFLLIMEGVLKICARGEDSSILQLKDVKTYAPHLLPPPKKNINNKTWSLVSNSS